MTKTEFINNLDFEVAKKSIARKLGMNANDLAIKTSKTGNFKIDIKNVSGSIGSLVSGSKKAIILTKDLNIKENNDNFSYSANVDITLKNNSGEYTNNIGTIDLNKNKFIFITNSELLKQPSSTVTE